VHNLRLFFFFTEWDVLLLTKRVQFDQIYFLLQSLPELIFKRECVNILSPSLFSYSAVTSTRMINQASAPTSVGIGGALEGFAMGVMELCRNFQWFHLTVFLDSSRSMKDLDLTFFNAAKSLTKLQKYSHFRIDGLSFTSSDEQSISSALKFAKQRSRGILLSKKSSLNFGHFVLCLF
jgi:hypothetical protein